MSRIDRSFARYCRTRDPQALAFVFDRSAPELLRLAHYLVPAAAEDLLQETFLVAIERADAFATERRVLPWLVGILVKRARMLRRQRRPHDGSRDDAGDGPLDASATLADPSPSPDATASHRELNGHLHAAVAALPVRYRELLLPTLQEGLAAHELAARLDRNPSTVRTQLARGLAHLRRSLPAVVAVTTLRADDAAAMVARVRAQVLPTRGAVAVSVAGTSVWWLAAAALFVGASVTIATAWPRRDSAASAHFDHDLAAAPAHHASTDETVQSDRDPPPAASLVATPATRAGPDRVLVPSATTVEVRGTCVDADSGQPLADCEVSIKGSPATDLARVFYGDDAWTDPPSVRTAADGRFVHRIAPTAAMACQVSVRADGRAAYRASILGTPDRPRTAGDVDLGELRLERGVPVTGRVVDEAGQPVRGCEVSFQWRTHDLFYDLCAEPFVSADDGTWRPRREPGRVPPHRFRLGIGAPVQGDTYLLGSPIWLPHAAPEVAVGPDGSIRLDLVLRQPRTLSGRVVDEQAAPVEGATVTASTDPDTTFVSVTVADARSQADGSFELRVRTDMTGRARLKVNEVYDLLEPAAPVDWDASNVAVRVRRRPASPPAPPHTPTVELRVVDAVTGEPVERFGYHLHPPQPPGGSARTMILHDGGDHPGGVVTTQAIPAGHHYLQVFPAWTHDSAYQDIEVPTAGRIVVRVALAPVTLADLAVQVERADGRPVANADVEAIEVVPGQTVGAESMIVTPFQLGSGHAGYLRGSGRSGPDGTCVLSVRKLQGVSMFTVRVRALELPAGIVPNVSLPASGNRVLVVVPDGATLSVRLDPPSLILSKVHLRLIDRNHRPVRTGPTPMGSFAIPPALSALPFAADGTLVVRGLAAGEVRPELVTMLQAGLPIPQRLELLPPVHLRAGQTTDLVVRLPHLVPGRVRGRVVQEGRAGWSPATELALQGVSGQNAALPTRTHGPLTATNDGTFEAIVPPGRYRLTVWNAPSGQPHARSDEEVEVAPGQTVEQTFVLR